MAAKPKPYTLTFRLRSPKHTVSTYQQVYLLLRVGDEPKISVTTGIFVEREQWFILEGEKYRARRFMTHSKPIESRLEEIRQQIDNIYRYQAKKSQIEGWKMTTRAVILHYQGLPYRLVKKPIKPCPFVWKVAGLNLPVYGNGRAAGL